MTLKETKKLETNRYQLEIAIDAEQFREAIKQAYRKEGKKITLPGYRPGKAPLAMIEKFYGKEVFYEDAANELMQNSYPAAIDESGVDIVSRPTVNVVQIKKGEPFIYTAEVATKPEVTLGDYKGIEIEKVDTEVTDEDVQKDLEAVQKKNARLVTVDDRAEKTGYKIREAQLQKIPYMLVLGDKESENGTVAVRSRKDGDLGAVAVDEFVAKVVEENNTKAK